MTSSFEQAGTQLAAVTAQQRSLAAAVASGELWMEAGVAEHAAAICDQTAKDINRWVRRADVLTWPRKFGDNEDGHAAAERYAKAGRELIDAMLGAKAVFENMAATYRAAGRTVRDADATNEHMLRGRSQ